MQKDDGLAGRIAAFFPIHLVKIGHAQPTAAVGVDSRIEFARHFFLRRMRD
jgi:hypothetical protein